MKRAKKVTVTVDAAISPRRWKQLQKDARDCSTDAATFLRDVLTNEMRDWPDFDDTPVRVHIDLR